MVGVQEVLSIVRQRTKFHNLDGLYGDVEAARREWESDRDSAGGKAFERWLEILEIADWVFEGLESQEEPDGEVAVPGGEHSGDAGQDGRAADDGRQLPLGGTAGLASSVGSPLQAEPSSRRADRLARATLGVTKVLR